MDADERLLRSVAAWLGEHALPVFVLGQGLLMGLVLVAWWGVRRYAMPQERGTLPPLAYLVVHLALGFALVVSAAGLFAALAEELAEGVGDEMGLADESFMGALRGAVPLSVVQAFAQLTRLGDVPTLAALACAVGLVLLWRRQWGLAVGWVVANAGNAALNLTLKMVFARVRPVHEHGLLLETGYSFPSGHSSGAVVAYGMLAYLLMRTLPGRWHLPLVLLASGLAYAVGASRVFLQVHYPSDVLAGWACGTVWLVVCVASLELLRRYRPSPLAVGR